MLDAKPRALYTKRWDQNVVLLPRDLNIIRDSWHLRSSDHERVRLFVTLQGNFQVEESRFGAGLLITVDGSGDRYFVVADVISCGSRPVNWIFFTS